MKILADKAEEEAKQNSLETCLNRIQNELFYIV